MKGTEERAFDVAMEIANIFSRFGWSPRAILKYSIEEIELILEDDREIPEFCYVSIIRSLIAQMKKAEDTNGSIGNIGRENER